MSSVIILAGGRSSRMGTDKAFLEFRGRYFIELIVDKALKVSDDVVITIGDKCQGDFELVSSDNRIRILSDVYNLANPLGGLLTGFDQVKNAYAAVVACDLPMVRSEVLEFLYERALNHSAAIPRWEAERIEPLCAVYKVDDAIAAARKIISEGRNGPRNMVAKLKDPCYVQITELRGCDKDLASFQNINSAEDYSNLINDRLRNPSGLVLGQ